MSWNYYLTDELRLQSAIFKSTYDRDIQPGLFRNFPFNIYSYFVLRDIRELDEFLGKFSLTGALVVSWYDDRMVWDPKNYGGDLEYITVPQKKIWVPYLINMQDYSQQGHTGHKELSIGVTSSGRVEWIVPNLYESICDLDLSKYPFDSQTCLFSFFAIGRFDLFFIASQEKADMSIFCENGLWEVTDTNLSTSFNKFRFHELRLSITVKRRSEFYLYSLILPIGTLSFLQLFVFHMPPKSGERIGFTVTVLLAIAVYMTLVQEKLLEASQPGVASLSYKLLGDFVIGSFIVIGVIMGLHYYHREEERTMSMSLQLFHRIMFPLTLLRRQQKIKDNEMVSPEDITVNTANNVLTWKDIGMALDLLWLI